MNPANNSTAGSGSETGTIFVDGEGGPGVIYVDQGPALLAELLYSPPPWARTALSLATLVFLVGLAVGYRRHGIDEDVLEEMGFNVLVVLGVLVVTTRLVRHLELPYWADVGGGTVGGFLLAKLALALVQRFLAAHRAQREAE